MGAVRPAPVLRAALAAALASVPLTLAAALAPSASPAAAAPTVEAAEPGEVFSGTVTDVQRVRGTGGRPATHVYEIAVDLVFQGDVGATATVRTTAAFERCDDATLTRAPGGPQYVFGLAADQDPRQQMTASRCAEVQVFSGEVKRTVFSTYGRGTEPGFDGGGSTPVVFPDVTYSEQPVGDPAPFDRAAAPGLAFVLVGLLGLVVVRRANRRR